MKKSFIKSIWLLTLISTLVVVLVGCGINALEEEGDKPVNTPVPETQNEIDESLNDTEDFEEEEEEEDEGDGTPFNNADKKRVKARGLYLTSSTAGVRLQRYIDLANTTEINAYVIDIKNEKGIVGYNSDVPLANEMGAVASRYDIDKVTSELEENDIYSIGRIVVFKDPILAENKPEYAIKNNDGGLYVFNGVNWVDPYNEESWQYAIDLAREALDRGFNEIQFDYIRFPDGRRSDMVFESQDDREAYQVVNDFLSYARQELHGEIISGDIFAIVCESPGDREGIGQYFEHVGKELDYISPMIYPSHYALGQSINGVVFPKPDLDPYGVVLNTLLKAQSRYEDVEGHTPVIRPFLQDFTGSWIGQGNYQSYGVEQAKQQIQAVYDAGYEEWLFWDPMNNYSVDAFEKID
ncbi:putative glycoside hydrolase [Herbivorax sp. ANBcel31]|uniref:putative glycoside hydrolase n=1 Tax=Herbivorax sp. ANBcel31 TaxID=3069754 RepID=UPI0027AFCB05|nr:putative glycoside hydrolase [Herbivorax sp. ANBcel31]MDQ2084844.1 putative glycoside hydrolase [Herbivorax sp. ANBcel31]